MLPGSCKTITWQNQHLIVQPLVLTYLGHVLAHLSHEEQAWDMGTNQLRHDVAAYKALPLNGFEKTAIINAVLLPRWCYKGLVLGNGMAHWDNILLQYLQDTLRVEPRMNKHRITTDIRDGRMGLRQAWWTFITRWVALGQNEARQTGLTDPQLSATQYKYPDAVRALGGSTEGLYDSESSEEDPKLWAGKLQIATHSVTACRMTA